MDGSAGVLLGWAERRVRLTVASSSEFLVRRIWTLSVCGFSANGTGDGWLEEIARVGLWWVWIFARLADIVDVKVVGGNASICLGGAKRPFDAVVAGVIRGLACTVGPRSLARIESWHALAVVGVEVGGVLSSGDNGFIGVVVGEVHVGLVLEGRIKPTVVDAEGY